MAIYMHQGALSLHPSCMYVCMYVCMYFTKFVVDN